MLFGVPLTFKAVVDFFTPQYIKEYEEELLNRHIAWCESFVKAAAKSYNKKTMREEYLSVLGLDKNASEEDIKKAYRRMAMHWHPDRNHSPEAEENFKMIKDAFEHLYP